jgi:integrase
LRKSGLKDKTIVGIGSRLRYISRSADLHDPEAVKLFIANKNCADSYKHCLVKTYNYYATFHGLSWIKPRYRPINKLFKVPTKEAIEKIIASASPKYATVFRLLMETGASPIELHHVTLRDIDFDKGTITIPGCKGHKARVIKLKHSTVGLLKTYMSQHSGFPTSVYMGKEFRKYRDRLAKKFNDPAFKQIRLYDLRHYFGTMLYHKTKDILYTMEKMGLTKLETALVYVRLIAFGEDEYTSAVAKNLKEAQKLIEAGFEYVTEMDGAKIFRKRK